MLLVRLVAAVDFHNADEARIVLALHREYAHDARLFRDRFRAHIASRREIRVEPFGINLDFRYLSAKLNAVVYGTMLNFNQ